MRVFSVMHVLLLTLLVLVQERSALRCLQPHGEDLSVIDGANGAAGAGGPQGNRGAAGPQGPQGPPPGLQQVLAQVAAQQGGGQGG